MKTTLQDVKVQKLGNGGIGIAQHQDGRKILIKGGALPGSIVDLKIIKKRKDHLEAHLINTKSYDPNYSDAEVFCPHFFTPTGISSLHAGTEKIGCGGCKRQMMNYKKQLEIKQQLVEESFGKINAKREKKIRFLPII